MFYWMDDSCNVMAILACHVDNFIWGATKKSSAHPSLESLFSKLDMKITASAVLEWRFTP